MNIASSTLIAQYEKCSKLYSFITSYEQIYALPSKLMYAVASRETNMTNEIGDYGHGHGMFQLDDRWHTIPAGFNSDVNEQAKVAANMLSGLISLFPHDLKAACSAYNTGVNNARAGINDSGNSDQYTAGGDYGSDVLDRMYCLQKAVAGASSPTGNPSPNGTTTTYVVVSGDTLSSIATKYGTNWQTLYAANRAVIGSNPNIIKPGERIIIPGKNVAEYSYRVVQGDTLTSIAAKYHLRWTDIYNANRGIIKNPNIIYPGQELIIP